MAQKTGVEKASFEKAYGFYRNKNDNAAIGVIRKLNQNEPRVMDLKAQILYRMGNYEEALIFLRKLLRTHSDEFDEMRRANLIAVQARLHSQGTVQEVDLISLDTFDLMYNAAYHLIVCEKFEEAHELLSKALEDFKRTLAKDGLDESAIQRETAPVLTQIAYVLQKMGKNGEAKKIYLQVLKSKSLDSKIKCLIMKNLHAAYIPYGKRWRPIKPPTSEREIVRKEEDKAATTTTINCRKRKRRLPANYDPAIAPDPERWLPRQERTAYRKKLHKKFKDRDVGRGTQGAAAGTSANIDYSTKSTTGGMETNQFQSPHSSPKPTEGPRPPKPIQAKKIKKKKGGKW